MAPRTRELCHMHKRRRKSPFVQDSTVLSDAAMIARLSAPMHANTVTARVQQCAPCSWALHGGHSLWHRSVLSFVCSTRRHPLPPHLLGHAVRRKWFERRACVRATRCAPQRRPPCALRVAAAPPSSV